LIAFAQDPHVDKEVQSDSAQPLGTLGRADEPALNGLLALAQDPNVNAGIRNNAYNSLKALLSDE
jgi:hypothetical protein